MQTKIIATIGPASLDFEVFQKMVDNGIDFIRINSAYGDSSQYDKILDNLKKAKKEKEIKVIFDIIKVTLDGKIMPPIEIISK